MSDLKIWMSNIGYGRGFSGALGNHLLYAYRHFYCSPKVQQAVMAELKKLVDREKPDICCLVEIDKGSFETGAFSQLHALLDEHYCHYDIANKYAENGWMPKLPITASKCNAFFANRAFPFQRRYLSAGVKRLVYQVSLTPQLTLFFCHFSLRRSLRQRQFSDLRALIEQTPGDHIVAGDFNILSGLDELTDFLQGTSLVLLNDVDQPTFRFHRRRRMLDLCFCSQRIRDHAELRLIEQRYSDHAALFLRLRDLETLPEFCQAS